MSAAAVAPPAKPTEYPVKTMADALFAETAAALRDGMVTIPTDSAGGLAKVPLTTSATLAARIDRAVRASRVFQDHGDVTRRLLLQGLSVDYDPPTQFWEHLRDLATTHVASVVAAIVPKLNALCKSHAGEPLFLLSVIDLLRYEIRRVTAELGATFQPLQAMPVSFFHAERISASAVVLASMRDSGSAAEALRMGIINVVVSAIDADRVQFPTRHAAEDPRATALRKQIAATLTFALSMYHDPEAGFRGDVFPAYVERLNATLKSFSQGLSVPQLISETATRVQNEADRAFVVLEGRRHGELRRIVQVAMLASQAERICKDPVHGVTAALAPPLPNAPAFAALVLALDFDAAAVREIGAAVERAGAAAVGRALTVATTTASNTATTEKAGGEQTTSVTALPPGERRMAVVEEVVRAISAFEACLRNANIGSEAMRLQFACRLRDGFRSALPRTGLEALLVETLDAMLLSAGRLNATDVERLATAARAAVTALAPYAADPVLLAYSHQLRLATRLRLRPAPHVALERFVVARLAEALGRRHLHSARAMIQDVENAPTEKKGAATSCVPLSSYAWPAFAYPSRDTTVLHPAIENIVAGQVALFDAKNGGQKKQLAKTITCRRTARAHPVLTMVTLAAPSGGGCIRGSALQCSALLHIADASVNGGKGASMAALASNLGVTVDEAAWVVATLAAAAVVTVTHTGAGAGAAAASTTTEAATVTAATTRGVVAAAARVTAVATTAVSTAASFIAKRATGAQRSSRPADKPTVAAAAAAAEDDLFVAAAASSSRTITKTGLFHPDTTVAVCPAALGDGRRVLLAPLMGRQAKRSRTAVGAAGSPGVDAIAAAVAASALAQTSASALGAASEDALAALGAAGGVASSRQLLSGVNAVDRPFLRHFYSVAATARAATAAGKDSGMGSRVPSLAPRPVLIGAGGGSPMDSAAGVVATAAEGQVAGSVALDMARVATAVMGDEDDMGGAEEADEPEGSSDDEDM